MHELNEQQKKAAYLSDTNVLIVAGAGSGKTSVLCHRIEHLINNRGINITNILAITFTVKAANELLDRIAKMIAFKKHYAWIGTFHGLSNRILRIHYDSLNLNKDFTILNDKEQLKHIKNILRDPEYSLLTSSLRSCDWQTNNLMASDIDDRLSRNLQRFINQCKDEGIRAPSVLVEDRLSELQQKFYYIYENKMRYINALDFGDLLLYSYELWQSNIIIKEHYQNRFKHIMIDEFQDINTIQYKWLLALHDQQNYIMAVGDDDQAIYGFRGSKSEYMQRFMHDIRDVQLIKLTQNYRSTQNILQVANHVISHNSGRLGKQLWSDKKVGEKIMVLEAPDPFKEALFVARRILNLCASTDNNLDDIAILYRLNSLSRLIEQTLSSFSIKYRVRGGVEFYQREEVKHVLAYLQLLINRNNNEAFRRVVNIPARGIGKKTISLIESEDSSSLWNASESLLKKGALNKKSTSSLSAFLGLINEMTNSVTSLKVDELLKMIIARSGLELIYQGNNSEEMRQRRENLLELVRAASQFTATTEFPALEFLDSTKLETYENNAEQEPAVNLMTIHSAKGLEFRHIFIIGMEEGILPIIENIEEERRLCYVAITRAKLSVVFTWCRFRMNDRDPIRKSSRFLSEIPKEYLSEFSI